MVTPTVGYTIAALYNLARKARRRNSCIGKRAYGRTTNGGCSRAAQDRDSAKRHLPRPSPPPAPSADSARCCCRWNMPTRRWTRSLAQISDWERELSAAVPPDSAPRIGSRRRWQPARLSRSRDRHRRVQPVLSGIPLRSPRRRDRVRPSHLSAGLRGPAGIGARRFPRGVLRLRHAAPELPCGTLRQDPFTQCHFPPAHARTDRPAFRHCAVRGRSGASRRRPGCCSTTRCYASVRSTRWRRRRTS